MSALPFTKQGTYRSPHHCKEMFLWYVFLFQYSLTCVLLFYPTLYISLKTVDIEDQLRTMGFSDIPPGLL